MFNCILSYVFLSTLIGSAFSHNLPLPHIKPEWEKPVVVSEEFFSPPLGPIEPHLGPHPGPEFKEIIGIELQRIPVHGGLEHEIQKHEHEILEHERHREQEILEHELHREQEILEHERRQHEILEHEHREHEFLEHHHPHEGLGPHELPHEHPHEHHHEHHHEHPHEHPHEHHEHPHEHDILEHEHREHDIMAHELPHEMHHPPWEDPDFILSEEEHHHEHEFHHEDLFPVNEVSRRRTNRRRQSSNEGGSRRNNSNSNSNRRENSNRRGNSNRRENSNRGGSRQNRAGGSNINTEELFPRRNRQNNNRRSGSNNSNNNRRNNNREGSRNSNLEELEALEEEIFANPDEVSRPQRQTKSYLGNTGGSYAISQSSGSQVIGDPIFHTQEYHSNIQGSIPSGPINTGFSTVDGFSHQQGVAVGGNPFGNQGFSQVSVISTPGFSEPNVGFQSNPYHSHTGNDPTHVSVISTPGFSESNIGFQSQSHQSQTSGGPSQVTIISSPGFSEPNAGFQSNTHHSHTGSSSNLQNEFSKQQGSRPDKTSDNIFIEKDDEYLTLDGSSRPNRHSQQSSGSTGSNFNNEQYNTNQQGSRPGSFENSNSNRPDTFGSSRPQSNRPGSSSSFSNQEERPSRPGSSSSFSNQEERPGRPGLGNNRPSLGLARPLPTNSEPGHTYLGSRPGSGTPILPVNSLHPENTRPGRPGSGSSFSNQEDRRPNRPSSSSSFLNEEERPSRPGSSSSFLNEEERPNRPGSSSSFSNQEDRRPSRPGSSSSFLNEEERPNRPGSGSSFSNQGDRRPNRPGSSSSFLNEEERPNRPGSGSSFSNQGDRRPSRPGSSSSFLNEEERPNRPGSSSSFSNQNERPNRPGSGSSGQFANLEERPNRPGSGSSDHFSNHEHRPKRPATGSSGSEGSRPDRPGGSYSNRPDEGSSRPRPSNGNDLYTHDTISVEEDPWLWPDELEDEDKPGDKKKVSTTTRRPSHSGNNHKKQHKNLKLLPLDSCGADLSNKIIGGTNTQLDEFPWMVLLQHSSEDGKHLGFGCGGSLISSRYVLTAAHCIKGSAIPPNVKVRKVRLGEFDISSEIDCQGEVCSPSPVDVGVEEIIVHPEYRASNRAQLHDIALIRLREDVKTSAFISPICLPVESKAKDFRGEKLTVAGWGKVSNGQNGKTSNTKLKVSLPVVSLEDCSPFYNRINIQLKNTQMCAGGEKGKDSCQGDSGGPLMGSEVINSQVRWQVYGVVSFGPQDCGVDNVAGVYTKVSEYIDWILDNMKK